MKLDHNQFGSDGVIALSEGLAVNPVLRLLSLTYCGITADGAEALFEIFIYSRSALEEVNLSGNLLMNEGVKIIFKGLSIAKSLKKIVLSDNQFSLDKREVIPEGRPGQNNQEREIDNSVMTALQGCMQKNEKLGKYNLNYNTIGTEGKFHFSLLRMLVLNRRSAVTNMLSSILFDLY